MESLGDWRIVVLFFLTCLVSQTICADNDDDSEGFKFSTDGGLGVVWVFNLLATLVIMIIFYNLRANDQIIVRGSGEASGLLPREEGNWVGSERDSPYYERKGAGREGSSKASVSEQLFERSPVSFSEDWRYHENAFARFFAFWGTWWSAVVLVSHSAVIHTTGFEGAAYLQMQKMIIVFFGILSVYCVTVLIPIYATSDNDDQVHGFSVSTAVNVPSDSARLWAAVVGGFFLLVGFLLYMYRFGLFYLEKPHVSSRFGTTVLVQGINREVLDGSLLETHIKAVFPDSNHSASVIPNYNEFEELIHKNKLSKHQLEYYTELARKEGGRPTLNFLDALKNFSFGVDAINYYEDRVSTLEREISALMSKPLKGSGTAFVTFDSLRSRDQFLELKGSRHGDMVATSYLHHEDPKSPERFSHGGDGWERLTASQSPPRSSSSSSSSSLSPSRSSSPPQEENSGVRLAQLLNDCSMLTCREWFLSKAVTPPMVIWESLSISKQEKAARRFTFTTALILVLLFFTTPIALLGGLNDLLSTLGIDPANSRGTLTALIPTLLLLLLTIALPPALEASSSLAKFNTKPRQESATMVNIFIFLYLSTFILPTFMLTTLAALAVVLTNSEVNDIGGMIFPNSAFFVSLMIQAALIGNGIELLLPGDLLRSSFGNEDKVFADFHYGLNYAYCLTYFAIAIFYAILVPVMAPMALIFFVIRHLVDKHNLLYRCNRGQGGLLDTYFLRSVISLNYVAAATSMIGLFLYLISKIGGVAKVGLVVVLLMLLIGIYIYLVIFVWSRKSGSSHWDEEEERAKDKKIVQPGDVKYVHPCDADYVQRSRAESL